jgi:2-methylcitrate dehydratase
MLMLEPKDYGHAAVFDKLTREIMEKIEFEHGGKEYDSKYPDGIPTSV